MQIPGAAKFGADRPASGSSVILALCDITPSITDEPLMCEMFKKRAFLIISQYLQCLRPMARYSGNEGWY